MYFKMKSVLGSIIVTIFMWEVVQSCSDQQMSNCLSDFESELKDGAKRYSGQQITAQQANSICNSAHSQFKTCVESFNYGCSATRQVFNEGAIDTVQYLCSADQIKYSTCLNSNKLQNKLYKCQETLDERRASVVFPDTEEQCKFLEEFLGCIYSTAEDDCGEAAAMHQLMIFQVLLGPTLNAAQCNLDINSVTGDNDDADSDALDDDDDDDSSTSSATGAMVGGIVGGVALLALVLVIVVCCIKDNNTKKTPETSQSPSHVVPEIVNTGRNESSPRPLYPELPPSYDNKSYLRNETHVPPTGPPSEYKTGSAGNNANSRETPPDDESHYYMSVVDGGEDEHEYDNIQ